MSTKPKKTLSVNIKTDLVFGGDHVYQDGPETGAV